MMRPQQNNKNRMRSRNNNRNGGGKGGGGGNPLQRGYESNGPEVKIRGTAQHVAEKYGQLGRDAQASGDHVLAESYFQHAEHYYRLIVAYQATLAQNNAQRSDDAEFSDNESGEGSEGEEENDDSFEGRQHRFPPREQQQRYQGGQDRNGNDRNHDRQGQERFPRRNHHQQPRIEESEQPAVAFPVRVEEGSDARDKADSPRRERFDRNRNNEARRERSQQQDPDNGAVRTNTRADSSGAGDEAAALPSFLTRTRRPRRAREEEAGEGANTNTPVPPASEA